MALGTGLIVGLLAALGPALGWRLSASSLEQAHAASQLDGWLGIFVAGFGLRLVPRLTHRPPPLRAVTTPVLGLLAGGVALRLVPLPAPGPVRRVAVVAEAAQAAGLLLFALVAPMRCGGAAAARANPGVRWSGLPPDGGPYGEC